MEIEIEEATIKKWGVALGVLMLLLAGLDLVLLRGEVVESGTASLREDAAPLVLQIDRVGEEHLVEISTRRHKNGENRGRSIAYRLIAPDGDVVRESSEIINHKRRAFDFTPDEPGEYTLEAHETTLIGSAHGTASVRVLVGDRRILSPVLGL